MNIKESLQSNLIQRQDEMAMYDININNFTLALELIDNTKWDDAQLASAMQEYKMQLQELRRQNIVEREKTRIIHDVIAAQLKE
jgi:UDP-N-acetylmuramyl pentapeptide synthase